MDSRATLAATARVYLTLAESLLEPRPAALVAIGGFSGPGKSTQGALLSLLHISAPTRPH